MQNASNFRFESLKDSKFSFSGIAVVVIVKAFWQDLSLLCSTKMGIGPNFQCPIHNWYYWIHFSHRGLLLQRISFHGKRPLLSRRCCFSRDKWSDIFAYDKRKKCFFYGRFRDRRTQLFFPPAALQIRQCAADKRGWLSCSNSEKRLLDVSEYVIYHQLEEPVFSFFLPVFCCGDGFT